MPKNTRMMARLIWQPALTVWDKITSTTKFQHSKLQVNLWEGLFCFEFVTWLSVCFFLLFTAGLFWVSTAHCKDFKLYFHTCKCSKFWSLHFFVINKLQQSFFFCTIIYRDLTWSTTQHYWKSLWINLWSYLCRESLKDHISQENLN